jgi:hypothetical protein
VEKDDKSKEVIDVETPKKSAAKADGGESSGSTKRSLEEEEGAETSESKKAKSDE